MLRQGAALKAACMRLHLLNMSQDAALMGWYLRDLDT